MSAGNPDQKVYLDAVFPSPKIREIPPGLLQHVLTVLVFWSWVLLLPRLLVSEPQIVPLG